MPIFVALVLLLDKLPFILLRSRLWFLTILHIEELPGAGVLWFWRMTSLLERFNNHIICSFKTQYWVYFITFTPASKEKDQQSKFRACILDFRFFMPFALGWPERYLPWHYISTGKQNHNSQQSPSRFRHLYWAIIKTPNSHRWSLWYEQWVPQHLPFAHLSAQ